MFEIYPIAPFEFTQLPHCLAWISNIIHYFRGTWLRTPTLSNFNFVKLNHRLGAFVANRIDILEIRWLHIHAMDPIFIQVISVFKRYDVVDLGHADLLQSYW